MSAISDKQARRMLADAAFVSGLGETMPITVLDLVGHVSDLLEERARLLAIIEKQKSGTIKLATRILELCSAEIETGPTNRLPKAEPSTNGTH